MMQESDKFEKISHLLHTSLRPDRPRAQESRHVSKAMGEPLTLQCLSVCQLHVVKPFMHMSNVMLDGS